MILAFFVGDIAKTVIEAINKIGSVFYGPILGVFCLAILTKSAHARAVNIGLVIGVLLNIYLWKGQPQVFWFWWNVIGLVTTFVIGYFGSKLLTPSVSEAEKSLIALDEFDFKIPETGILLVYFVLILLVSLGLPWVFG